MKKIITLLLALAMTLSLVACGGSKKEAEKAPSAPEAQDGTYLFKGYNDQGDITTDPLPQVSDPLDPAAVYSSMTYVEEMFFGHYSLGESYDLDEEQRAAYLADYKHMTIAPGTTNFGEYTEDVPALPYRISAGPESLSHVLSKAANRYWAELYFYNQNGNLDTCKGQYQISGNQFIFTPAVKWEYNQDTKHLTYQMSQIQWVYEFSFRGPHMTLSQGGQSITLTASYFRDPNYFCQGSGYVKVGTPTFDQVDEIGLVSGTRAFIEAEDGNLYHTAVVGLTEDGLMTLSWKDRDGNSYLRQFVYFLCGFDGLVLADSENHYLFTVDSRYDESLNNSITAEERELLGKMDQEEVAQIMEKRADLLSDLADAYQQAGLAVTVNQETGEILMDSSVLFGVDSYEISPEGQEFLTQFMGVYTSVVFSETYSGFISSIMVEGHTDTSGDYDYNLELSQKRADSVRDFCLSDACGVAPENLAALEEMLIAAGYSYTNPIYDANGQVDMAASRRVAFRFLINLSN